MDEYCAWSFFPQPVKSRDCNSGYVPVGATCGIIAISPASDIKQLFRDSPAGLSPSFNCSKNLCPPDAKPRHRAGSTGGTEMATINFGDKNYAVASLNVSSDVIKFGDGHHGRLLL